MQGLAKQSRHTMYTEAQLVSFGNYLLSQPKSIHEVDHATLSNWKESQELPYQEDQFVWFTLWSYKIAAQVLAIHPYGNKFKYDLKLIGHNGEETRIYNVDSKCVAEKNK